MNKSGAVSRSCQVRFWMFIVFNIALLLNTERVNSPGGKKAAEAATVKFGHLCSSQLLFLHTAEPSHDKKM